MSFEISYAKLLSDPDFGHIKKRREHAKQMYLEGMKDIQEIWLDSSCDEEAYEASQKLIAEESK